jgi:hypothetical protein
MSDNLTPFSKQCEILADLWINYRNEKEFSDFIEYNDIGLPLAYAVSNSIANVDTLGQKLIEETFDLLLEGLGVDDTGFDNLDDLLGSDDLSADEE